MLDDIIKYAPMVGTFYAATLLLIIMTLVTYDLYNSIIGGC